MTPTTRTWMAWINDPLTATMTQGEALLAVPIVVAWVVSGGLLGRYATRWLRRHRAGGNGLTLVSRANARREAFRTVRLTLWLVTAVALALDWPTRGLLFVISVLGYAWSELANALLEWSYQRWAERFLVHRAPPPDPPPVGY